ncbi:MAG: heme lyase CcmF/NrfE family subunit [Chloroflexi bacterium]|nr:heme lyase CcmF/NrfE family subunit [Chloroflexota bacterium]
MADIGYLLIVLGLAAAVYSMVTSVYGVSARRPALVLSGRNAALVAAGLTVGAALMMEFLLLTHDFNVRYVAETTQLGQSLYLTITALWGAQAGSLLFWSTILAGYTISVILVTRNQHRDLLPWATSVLMLTLAFFLTVLVFLRNPFERLTFIPADGTGLNPLLQHGGMMIHPPNLYMGFVGFTVPFAFAMAALITGRLDDTWIRTTRIWTMIAWTFLSMGVLLGGRWAYDVLGWGGYWGWDPVENASLLPWLTATAFIHSVMVQERKGMLKIWNMILIVATYGLVIFGTFLTRSGVISSVHAFALSNLGPMFLGFLTLVLLMAVGLIIYRRDLLRSKNQVESLVSREASFLLNNMLMVGVCFAVLWGTIFPMISEIFTGDKITVGPPFFNKTVGPIFALTMLVMGFIPLIGWGGATTEKFLRHLIRPAIATGIGALALFLLGVHQVYALIGFSLCLFTGYTTVSEFVNGTIARRRATGENPFQALVNLIQRNRRRYGGYLVHIAVVFIGLGIVGSQFYKQEVTQALSPGESMQIGDYTLTYLGLQQDSDLVKQDLYGQLMVSQGGQQVGVISPQQEFFTAANQVMTIPAIRSTPKEDLYVIVAGIDTQSNSLTFTAHINPLVMWIWLGGVLLILGTIIAAWPAARREPAPVTEAVAERASTRI